MADIIKKNDTTQRLATRNPLRAMQELMQWDPFREMAPLFPSLAELNRDTWMPSFDVSETPESFVFKADVPGVKKEELEISTTGNRLQISGKRDSEHETKTDTLYTYERQYGSFSRSFTLPDGTDIEHAKSELKDGVLTLIVPKLPAAQAKQIPISTGGTKSS